MRPYVLRQIVLIDKLAILWFATIFSLSSNLLKVNLGMISLSPAVIIPLLGLVFFPLVRRPFLNAHLSDRKFKYTVLATLAFLSLMIIQTILSDWPMEARSELLKTFLFFFLTHSFFAMMLKTQNLRSAIRLSLLISAIFIAYLAYLYLYKFGVSFIGNELSWPDQVGRNTLSLFVFTIIIISTALIIESRGAGSRFFDFPLLLFFVIIGLLIGSRFTIFFPALFFIFIFLKQLFKIPTKKELLFIVISGLIVVLLLIIGYTQETVVSEYFIVYDRILNMGETGGDLNRLTLINVGFDCFLENGILFGHGVKDYLSCVESSSIGSDLVLHNEHLSILNNVGIVGYALWVFIISTYSKIFSFSRENYTYRLGVIIFLGSLLIVDAYNSPIFALLLAFSRLEWARSKGITPWKYKVGYR
jgi:hypothetical protein